MDVIQFHIYQVELETNFRFKFYNHEDLFLVESSSLRFHI